MATISDILGIKWPDPGWTIDGDDYAALKWYRGDPKPTEAEIRAYSAEVDAILAQKNLLVAAEERLLQAGPAQFLMFVQTCIEGFTSVYESASAEMRASLDANPRWQKVVAAGKQALGQ